MARHLSLGLLAVAMLCGCSAGDEVVDQARNYQSAHKKELLSLAAQLRPCTSSDLLADRIAANEPGRSVCVRKSGVGIDAIRTRLKALDVVNLYAHFNNNETLDLVSFELGRRAVAGASQGINISLTYVPKAGDMKCLQNVTDHICTPLHAFSRHWYIEQAFPA